MTNHTLWLLRHGLSTGNRDHLRQGQRDFPLTDEGRQQAHMFAQALEQDSVVFQAIIASPLARANETAEIIATVVGLPVEIDERWMERHGGTAEGQPLDRQAEAPSTRTNIHAHKPLFIGGESRLDLHLRAASALQDLLRREPGDYLIVAHGGILSEAVRTLLGWSPTGLCPPPSFRFDNCGYAQLTFHAGRRTWMVERVNETGHLRTA
ncbi:MAG: histidine phosphatase family protein [Anaerolineales bacterium]